MTTRKAHILVIDNEKSPRELLLASLKQKGYEAEGAEQSEDALQRLKDGIYDLVLIIHCASSEPLLDCVEKIRRLQPEAEIVMIAGFSNIDDAVEAMRHGIFDFVQKPYRLENLLNVIEKALQKNEVKLLMGLYEASRLIFSSMKMEDLLDRAVEQIKKVMEADSCSLMLLNESGKLTIAAHRGMDEKVVKGIEVEVGDRVAGRAFKEAKPYLLIDKLDHYSEFDGVKSNAKIHSSMVIPLISGLQVLGVMNINRFSPQNHFNQRDLRNATIFAAQVGQAVQNAKLFQEIEKKAEEVRQAHEVLKQAQHQLMAAEKLVSIGRLVGGLSHEINNPLTAVIGYAQMLLDGQYKDGPEDKLRIIIREARRCEKIIQHLRTFARVSRARLEPVNPCALLNECLEMIAGDIKINDIQVEKKYPYPFPEMEADPDQLRQIFVNILSNAVLALENHPGVRQINVDVRMEDGQAIFDFTDSGAGIPEEHLAKIFDPFFTTREVGKGTGLGLSLVYAMAEEHHGKVRAQNVKGGGAKFSISFPLKRVSEPASQQAKEATAQNLVSKTQPRETERISRVLVVEDEETVRNLLLAILGGRGYEVDTASDGEGALEKIRKNSYELIVCDFRLPKLNGGKLYEAVKGLNDSYARRFLFISGSAEMGDGAFQFFQKNLVPYLPKPFSGDELFEIIDKYFQKKMKTV
ncbi:MAG: response regulator [Candidatus Omnitrophica bacterium]|nr:response regulator [Candidatus Omnitrophota bacterium]